MTVDDLLVMTEDQVDYEGLDLELLDELVRQEHEPFIATSALATQQHRDPGRAIEACRAILRRAPGDPHLRAFAMTSLYALAPAIAKVHMRELVNTDPLDAKLLAAMVDNAMQDLDGVRADPPFVKVLVACVRRTPIEQFSEPDDVRRFIDLFRDGLV